MQKTLVKSVRINSQQTLATINSIITKGRASCHLQNEEEYDDDDDDDEANNPQEHATGEKFEVLKNYLPKSVLTFLLHPDPLRFIN